MGKINYAISIVTYFALLASLGMSTYGVREINRVKKEIKLLDKTFSQLFLINIITTSFSFILLFIMLLFIDQLNGYKLLILIQSGNILFNVFGADWFNTAMEDFKFVMLRNFLIQVLSIISMFIFVKSQNDYLFLVLIGTIASAVSALLNIRNRKKYTKITFTRNIEIKRHLPKIFGMFLLLFSLSILNNLDITMLGYLKGPYEVGKYSTALKITNIVAFSVTSISFVTLPKLTLLFAEKKFNDINVLLDKILSFTILLGLPSLIGLNIIAKDLIMIIAGSEYLGSVPVIRLLSLSVFAMFISGIYGNMILIPSLKENRFIFSIVFATILNIITNFIFIPLYGVYAASLTTFFSHTVIVIISRISINKEIKFGRKFDIYLSPIIGTLFILFTGYFGHMIDNIWTRLLVILIISIFIYLMTLTIFKHNIIMLFWNFVLSKLSKRKD